jgi:hypothetical protein
MINDVTGGFINMSGIVPEPDRKKIRLVIDHGHDGEGGFHPEIFPHAG